MPISEDTYDVLTAIRDLLATPPGSTFLAETIISDLSSQKTLAGGVSSEDGSTPVAIPSGATYATIQVQGAEVEIRPAGTTLNTARALFLDPGEIRTLGGDLSTIIFKGSTASVIYVAFYR